MRTERREIVTANARTPAIAIFAAGALLACAHSAQAQFSLGVAAGDVAESSAVLWTRADQPGPLRLELSTSDDFVAPQQFIRVEALEQNDQTAKVLARALTADTLYFYRFVRLDDGAASPVGRFRTPPKAEAPASLRFVFSGDTNFAFAPFGVFAAVARESADLTIWFGDTIYADVPAGGLGVARTLDEYRAKYRQIRGDEGVRAAGAAAAMAVGWDDHELSNDYAGRDPLLSATQRDAAYQAFFEYMPIAPSADGDPADPYRTYRALRFGANAEFFFLDCRQYRELSAEPECGGNVDPEGFITGRLTADSACVERLRAPREMLGSRQFEWLTQRLASSSARLKFVVNNVPLSYVGVLPYDRWDGYDAERRALLRFIDENAVPGVIFLTTDIHANALNPDVLRYFRQFRADYGLRGTVRVPEIIVGPLGNETMRQSLLELVGGASPLQRVLPLGEALLRTRLAQVNGLTFIETDRVAYAAVEVDASGGVQVTFRGARAERAADADAVESLYSQALDLQPAGQMQCGFFSIPLLLAPALALLARRDAIRRI